MPKNGSCSKTHAASVSASDGDGARSATMEPDIIQYTQEGTKEKACAGAAPSATFTIRVQGEVKL